MPSEKSMTEIPDILKRILARKVEEIDERNLAVDLRKLSRRVEDADMPRGFLANLKRKIDAGYPAVIAEVKKASSYNFV